MHRRRMLQLAAGAALGFASRTAAADGLSPFDTLMTGFLAERKVPGAALAVARHGKLVYARGFGFADVDKKEAVRAAALFRIASVSKPITAAAIVRLVEMKKLKLADRPFELLAFAPPPGKRMDPRLKNITVRQILQHTGGWDRDASFDPMFRPLKIASALNVAPPAEANAIVRYMAGEALDFDPGTRYAYSNFGYCVLGRVIEKVTGQSYESAVRDLVLNPLDMRDTVLGRTLTQVRGEVVYRDPNEKPHAAVVGPRRGQPVPPPYGTWYLEAMDAHGGWLSSAVDLAHFGAAFDTPGKLLTAPGLRAMFGVPEGPVGHEPDGSAKQVYYGLGWQIRRVDDRGAINTWHNGALDGSASLLVRRHDGLCWAVLFNARSDTQGRYLGGLVDPLLHQAASRVTRWPAKGLAGSLGE